VVDLVETGERFIERGADVHDRSHRRRAEAAGRWPTAAVYDTIRGVRFPSWLRTETTTWAGGLE
jgi:hypothetical protein